MTLNNQKSSVLFSKFKPPRSVAVDPYNEQYNDLGWPPVQLAQPPQDPDEAKIFDFVASCKQTPVDPACFSKLIKHVQPQTYAATDTGFKIALRNSAGSLSYHRDNHDRIGWGGKAFGQADADAMVALALASGWKGIIIESEDPAFRQLSIDAAHKAGLTVSIEEAAPVPAPARKSLSPIFLQKAGERLANEFKKVAEHIFKGAKEKMAKKLPEPSKGRLALN